MNLLLLQTLAFVFQWSSGSWLDFSVDLIFILCICSVLLHLDLFEP